VGKSTLGRELSVQLGWPLIDLDLEFCDRLAMIGAFITEHGYAQYRSANLALAEVLLAESVKPLVFVTSSGFLAGNTGTDDYSSSRRLVATGYIITLLPSLDIETATAIVVARQLGRGFGLERKSEEQKFRERFSIYRNAGSMLVASVDPPASVAAAVIQRLSTPL